MSVASLSAVNNGFSYPLVIQQGTLIKVANTPKVVPCYGILATDDVLLTLVDKTASTANSGGAELITIAPATNGGQFTATSTDAVFAGTYNYVVVRSSARTVNA